MQVMPDPLDSRPQWTPSTVPGMVGVLGGMGPLATVDFMQKLVAATTAQRDQDHVPTLVSSIPQIPDRTEAFRGEGASPLDAIADCAFRLVAAGAGLIVIPCNTAHLWFNELQARIDVPMLHIVDATLALIQSASSSRPRIGLLATDATLASGLYINRRSTIAAQVCPEWLQPTATETVQWVMPGIAAVKGGELERGRELLQKAAHALHRRGAQSLVMGCTEIPLVLNDSSAPLPTIDATAALAGQAVQWSCEQRLQTTVSVASAEQA